MLFKPLFKMGLNFFLLVFVVPVLIAVIYFDYKWRRIPNFITFPLIISGFLIQVVMGGWSGLQNSLAGFFIGGCIFLILYLLGGMGAGDVKLVGGIGAFLGVQRIIVVIITTFFIGGLMAILKILKRTLSANIENGHIFTKWLPKQWRTKNNWENVKFKSETIPYGIAISLGTLITIFLLN